MPTDDADDDRQQGCRCHQLECHQQPAAQVVVHRLLGTGGDPEVALEDVAEPQEVAGDGVHVEVERID